MTVALLSTKQVADLAGITFRMIDHWDRNGVIHASVPAEGSGSRRRYTLGDVRLIQVVKLLRELNAELEVAARAVEELRELEEDGCEWSAVVGVDPSGALVYEGEPRPDAFYGLNLDGLTAEPTFTRSASVVGVSV